MNGRHRNERAARPTTRRAGAVVAAALVVTVLGTIASAGLWLHHRSAVAGDRDRVQALAAARSAAQDILSYDYRSLQAGIDRAKAETTGPFAKQYADTARQLLTQAKQVQAIVQATVGSAGVVDRSSDGVVVLLFVDQASVKQLPGAKAPDTRIDQSRVRLTMTREHGRWLVSALAAL